jgi:periplasmic divalent cation tolerance protein
MTAHLIYSTWPGAAEAELCAAQLIERRLAACVTVLPGAHSTFRWDGQVQRSTEAIMLVKTTNSQSGAVLEAVRAAHPYDLPCVLAFAVGAEGSNPEFLQWVATETTSAA